jgi:opacity protein-like surface antigen
MKNITLAMVLAAVTMLSAVLAVPMQQAIAEGRDGKDGRDGKYSGDGKDGRDGKDSTFDSDENSIDAEIESENRCGGNEDAAVTSCLNTNAITNIPAITLSLP